MTLSLREPAVAGQFYPGSAAQLNTTLDRLMPVAADRHPAVAVMVPHAGYIYSGAIAAETFAGVSVPRRVMLFGPNHHGLGEPAALTRFDQWKTPLGPVAVDGELQHLLLQESDLVSLSDSAHRHEHSIEVQIPFLQRMQPDLLITPLCLMHQPLDRLLAIGIAVAASVRKLDEPVLLVASTDMTHFESAATAKSKDQLALADVLALDPERLYQTVRQNRISMCGMVSTVVVLVAARLLGGSSVQLVRYGHSGEVNGDFNEVVGYAGAVIRATH